MDLGKSRCFSVGYDSTTTGSDRIDWLMHSLVTAIVNFEHSFNDLNFCWVMIYFKFSFFSQ
jgi:hypothetical protein